MRSTSDLKTPSEEEEEEEEEEDKDSNKKKYPKKNQKKPTTGIAEDNKVLSKPKWSCVDSCCWSVGCMCIMWWFLLFLYNAMPASLLQYVTESIMGPLPDPPGLKLRKEGLETKHPVAFVPGIGTAAVELWEGHQCADGLFQKRLWGGTFGEVYKSLIKRYRFLLLSVIFYVFSLLAVIWLINWICHM